MKFFAKNKTQLFNY